MNSMNESGNYESEQEELIILMEQIQTTNERLQAELKGLQQKYSRLQQQSSQQETQIQMLLSDKQKLSEQVQKQMLQIQELQSSNQKLQSQVQKLTDKNKQLSEDNRKLKEIGDQLEEERRGANQREAQLKRKNAQLLESIDKSAEEKAKRMVQSIIDEYENKQKRVNKFAVATIWILMVYSICVTGAWISDHISVFAGRTGVGNFFVSVGNGFMVMCDGVGYFLNCAVSTLQGATGNFAASGIVYTSFAVAGLLAAFLGVWKGIPKLKEKFRKILNTYRQNGVVGYKKAMTVSLCVIALCFAILLAEYAMVNVIGVWLLMSVGFNLTYHLATYER